MPAVKLRKKPKYNPDANPIIDNLDEIFEALLKKPDPQKAYEEFCMFMGTFWAYTVKQTVNG